MRTNPEQMEQATRYLRRFGELKTRIRRLLQVDMRVELSRVLWEFRERLPLLSKQIAVIEDLAQLRNVVAHGNERTGKVIPTVEAIEELEASIKYVTLLTGSVTQFFKHVRQFLPEDSFATVLKYMHDDDFSQVAVRIRKNLNLSSAP